MMKHVIPVHLASSGPAPADRQTTDTRAPRTA